MLPADTFKINLFQSTPSARRATCCFCFHSTQSIVISIHALREEGDCSADCLRPVLLQISIHALREEGDLHFSTAKVGTMYFNPRPPRGGRLELSRSLLNAVEFQSTPSARRAT